MNCVTLESVSKSYGEKVLLDNIELRVNQGDKIALIAQNGSGKTTSEMSIGIMRSHSRWK